MPTVSEDPARDPASDQPIIRDLRRGLRGDSPLDLLGLISYGSTLESQELLDWFGVRGSVSQRAHVFLAAIGVDPHRRYGAMDLGSPDYLVGERRRDLIAIRDRWLAH